MKSTLLIALCYLFIHINGFAQEEEFHMDEVFNIDKGGMIKLSSDDAQVTITGSDRKDVHIKIDRSVVVKGLKWGSRDFTIDVEVRNGDIYIREKSRGSVSMVGYSKEDYKILLEVPHHVSLDIEGDDDDYEISGINGSVALDIDDGNAELRNCIGQSFRFKLDDGDITMDQASGKLFFRADDGDLRVRNATFSDIDATLDDGDLMIETSLTDNGEYYFRADDSDITLDITKGGGDFKVFHDDTRISSSEEFSVTEKSENRTNLKLANGTARIEIRADDARVKLAAK